MAAGYDLIAKIGADTSGVKRGLKDTSRALNKTSRQLNQNERTWKSWSIRSVAATVALGMAISAVSRKTVEYADAFKTVSNKLKIATDGTEELTHVTSELFKMANENRSNIETTVDSYSKLERGTRELGFTSERLLGIVDVIGKAFIVGGATAKEMDGAMRQLNQGISSGTLRGEEFNSVAEQAPVIMEAIKSATGKTAGELRKLAATGAITAKILIQSLDGYKEKILGDFAKTQATYSGKMNIARNKAIEFVGANEDIKKAVDAAGDAIVYLSENIEGVITTVERLAVLYGATLVNAIAKAGIAKAASIRMSLSSAAAHLQDAQAAKVDAAANIELAQAELVEARAAHAALLAQVKSAQGKAGNAAASKALAAANIQLAATSKAVAAAQAQLAVATNVVTAATRKSTVAQRALNFARGNIGTIAVLAAYALYEFVDWETKAEKQLKATTKEINKQINSLGNLGESALKAVKEGTQKDADEVIAKINKLDKEIAEQQKKVNAAKTAETLKLARTRQDDLKKERSDLRDHLSVLEKLQQGQSAEMLKRLVAVNNKKQILIDMDYNAAVEAAKKYIDVAAKKARDEIKVAQDARDKLIASNKLVAEAAVKEIKLAKEYEGNKAADIKAINEQLAADLITINTNSEAAILEIKKKAAKDAETLRKQSPEFKAQERLKKIADSLKSEAQLEQDRWAEQKAFLATQGATELSMDAEKKQLFQDAETAHQAKMRELRGDDTFIDELKESFATEAEFIDMKYASDLERLAAFYEGKKGLDQEYADWKDRLDQENRDRQAAASQASNALELRSKTDVAQGIFNIAKNFGGKSKKMQKALFLAEKGIAIGRAVVATNLAAAQALASLPYPANLAAVAQVQMMGNLNIAAIAASALMGVRNVGSGGGGSSRSAGGGGSAISSSGFSGGASSQQPASPRAISIDMTGSSMFSVDQVRELVEQINNQVGDGVSLVTTGG